MVNAVLDPISNMNNVGMAKGKVKEEYTKAANEGSKEFSNRGVTGLGGWESD